MDYIKKLVLGTAQFGLDYGINNWRGKIPKQEVFKILSFAKAKGISYLDTARSYGCSEKIIGEYQKHKSSFNIISKLPECDPKEVENIVTESLYLINIPFFYGYLIHDFNSFRKEPIIYHQLLKLKEKGIIKRTGFSLYYPIELEYLLENNIFFNIIQIPYNIFDQRFSTYFKRLHELQVEINVRSIFLQGLVFKEPNKLNGSFIKIKQKIEYLNNLSAKYNIPISILCLYFVLFNDLITYVLFGIDSLNQLNQLLKFKNYNYQSINIYKELLNLKEDNEQIILPINWK